MESYRKISEMVYKLCTGSCPKNVILASFQINTGKSLYEVCTLNGSLCACKPFFKLILL